MQRSLKLWAAAAILLLLGTGAALAQAGSTSPDPGIPCPAFARDANGGWKVTQPVTLNIAGMLISFTVGTDFGPDTTTHGIAMPVILDRQCGNVPGARAEAPAGR